MDENGSDRNLTLRMSTCPSDARFIDMNAILFRGSGHVDGITTAVRAGWRLFDLWWEYRPYGGPGTLNTHKGIWFVALFLVKLTIIIVCVYYAAYFFNLGFSVPL
ncbi:MAG: hypothetical protein DRO93_03075 [Candidatus Thorarchaeota archaeon]|nr:MAG: hypothetical protein DRO93_03075 [Candidatus Thorarchaeota archaeon]